MKQQYRKSVFETNSSTSHTLTIRKLIDDNDIDKFVNGSMIPSNTTFEFCNSSLQDIEDEVDFEKYGWNSDKPGYIFHTEIQKLALCIAYCKNSFTNDTKDARDSWYWDYKDEAEGTGLPINEYVSKLGYFRDLVQAVKEERNTDLVFSDNGIFDLDSLNDDDAFLEFDNFRKENKMELVDFFKTVIFGNFAVDDRLLPC